MAETLTMPQQSLHTPTEIVGYAPTVCSSYESAVAPQIVVGGGDFAGVDVYPMLDVFSNLPYNLTVRCVGLTTGMIRGKLIARAALRGEYL